MVGGGGSVGVDRDAEDHFFRARLRAIGVLDGELVGARVGGRAGDDASGITSEEVRQILEGKSGSYESSHSETDFIVLLGEPGGRNGGTDE